MQVKTLSLIHIYHNGIMLTHRGKVYNMEFNKTRCFQIGPGGHITIAKCVKLSCLNSPKAVLILHMDCGACEVSGGICFVNLSLIICCMTRVPRGRRGTSSNLNF